MNIHAQRVLLRDFTLSDFPAIHAFDLDPELRRYRGGGQPTEEHTHAFLQKTQKWLLEEPRSTYAFAIIRNDNWEMIGVIGFTIIERDFAEAELWYRLCRRYWNQGYITEAAQAMLSFGFTDLHMHRIAAMCDPENIGSWKVMKKIGMRFEGCLRESFPRGDETWRDSLLYAIIDHEWFEVQKASA